MRAIKTLIVDNYDSFTFNLFHLVAAINGVEPLVVRNDELTWEEFENLGIDNVVISAGPGRPENERDFGICRRIILESRLPILGVCLGLQGVGYLFGGKVVQAPEPVHGRTSAIFHDESGIFAGIPQGFHAVRYHSLIVSRSVPDALRITAWTDDKLVMGLEHRERPIWAVQFHPESVCTEYGAHLVKNFAERTPDCRRGVPRPPAASGGSPPLQGGELLSPLQRRTAAKRQGVVGHRAYSQTGCKVFTRRVDVHPSTEQTFCSLFDRRGPAFWLDTPIPEEGGRFSFMGEAVGARSFWLSYSCANRRLVLNQHGHREVLDTSLLDFLQSQLELRRTETPELPFDFNGGFVGYLGYELRAECGSQSMHRSPHADACLIFPDRLFAFDHHERAVHLLFVGLQNDSNAAEEWFDETERFLRSNMPESSPPVPRPESIRFRLEQSRQEYLDSIHQCLRFIRDGESYEICLTNRLAARTTVDPLAYYRALRHSNPSPYSAFLRFPDVTVACSSPELFLRIDRQGVVESKPIKGTAPRSGGAVEDEALREGLRTGVKTRSENLMIVDLLRHDLGRVSGVGSVHVPAMMEVESYKNLHQLVSTVRGHLRPGATTIDCVRSAFPGGSMTGAPKLRTMELIDRLENSARGVYSGAIGFFALNGAANLNIVIRTAVFAGGSVSIGAGGAVVALSDPAAEFDEMILKTRALVDAFRPLIRGGTSIEGVDTIAD